MEGKIDNKTYELKKEENDKKVEVVDKKILQLQLLLEDDKSIENGLKRLQEQFTEGVILKEFDSDIFNALVDFIIVGETKDNEYNPYTIKIVLKNNKKQLSKNDDWIKNIKEDNIGLNVLEFFSKTNFTSFERNDSGYLEKKNIKNVHVMVKCDII